MHQKMNALQIGLKFEMGKIKWKTKEEKMQEIANQPLPVEMQLSNILFQQTISSINQKDLEDKQATLLFDAAMKDIKIQEVEKSNANIILTLAMNGIS